MSSRSEGEVRALMEALGEEERESVGGAEALLLCEAASSIDAVGAEGVSVANTPSDALGEAQAV